MEPHVVHWRISWISIRREEIILGETIWGETIFETGANGEQPFALNIVNYGLPWTFDRAQELRTAIPYAGKNKVMQNGANIIKNDAKMVEKRCQKPSNLVTLTRDLKVSPFCKNIKK